MDGADPDVVGVGRVDLVGGVCREPDRHAEAPCHVDRQVVLADVHVVGADQRRAGRAGR